MADLTSPIFHDEAAARAHFEALRWPNGPVCPHCGSLDKATGLKGKSHRAGLYQCNACREPYSVTVGTVMESSHVPLQKWALAFFLIAASKKGISAHQLHRTISVTYKTAWFMAHRIREAMNDKNPTQIGGEGKVVEADETYHGTKEIPVASKRGAAPYLKTGSGPARKRAVVALVERGGEARAVAMTGQRVNAKNVAEVLTKHIDAKRRLHTDESGLYPTVGRQFAAHQTVNHSKDEYARWEKRQMITTNSVEGFFGVFKRGFNGIYQHCGEQHFQRYVDEYTFRYNNRSRLGCTDTERAAKAIKGAEGKRLTYRGTCSP